MSLHEAAREGNVENVRQLLSANTEAINDRDRHSRTPLHIASWAGHAEVVKVLCDANADVGAAAQDDMAAIHFASQKGHTDVVRTLLLAGAYVNARTRKGMTPLHFAAQGSNAELVKLLVRKGANLDTENKAKKKPVDVIRDESLRSVIREAEVERDTRRAKSKEKPKQQVAAAEEEKGEATTQGEAHISENVITVSERPDQGNPFVADRPTDVEKTRAEEPTGVSREVDERDEDEDANVVIGPKRKKAKVALTHLFSEKDDDDVE